MKGELEQICGTREEFHGVICLKLFLSTYCVPYAGLLVTELKRIPMKGSP